jgi:anthranilate phosphoribosyltransferase
MVDRFTDRARKVMGFARQEAERFQRDYIGTEHILLGLMREDSGVGGVVLRGLGINLESARQEVIKPAKPGSDISSVGQLSYSPHAKKALEYAVDEARLMDHNYVGTEHLLLGLLRVDESLAVQVLKNLSLDPASVRKKVLEFLKREPEAATQLPKKICLAEVQDPNDRGIIDYTKRHPTKVAQLRGCVPSAPVPKEPAGAQGFAHGSVSDMDCDAKIKAMSRMPAASFNPAPYLETLLAGKDLSSEDATLLAKAIAAGRVGEGSLAALLMALRAKGESVAEVAAFAKVMRDLAVAVKAPAGALDTCGTGGDKSGTFNISTAVAFVAAGMGIPVAKHGGRAVSSQAGSADVLTSLGVNTDVEVACIEKCLQEAGIGFMFAPAHHPGMKHVSAVRKELGVRTIFNLLGPLANPAGAKLQLMGVCDPAWCEKLATVLALLGSESALVVCGAGPGGVGHLDEISTFGPTKLARLNNGQVSVEELKPESLGFQVPASGALRAANAAESAAIITAVLEGKKGPPRDIVLLNAAAAALVAKKAADWPAALALAAESIDSRRALAALQKIKTESRK